MNDEESNRRKSPAPSPGGVANLDLRRLETFVLAAETLNFGGAARRLNVVPSAVSHSIRSLESELGFELFQRKGPHLELTRAGARLVPVALGVLERMRDLRDTARVIGIQSHSVRIGAPELICSRLLPAALLRFHEQRPLDEVVLIPISSVDPMGETLESHEIDLAISVNREPADSNLRHRLFDETLAAFVHPAHPLANRSLLAPCDLVSHSLVVADADAERRLWECFRVAPELRPGEIILLPSVESVEAVARMGSSIAVLPPWALRRGDSPLISLELPTVQFQRTWSAFWNGDCAPFAAAELLVEIIEEHARSLG